MIDGVSRPAENKNQHATDVSLGVQSGRKTSLDKTAAFQPLLPRLRPTEVPTKCHHRMLGCWPSQSEDRQMQWESRLIGGGWVERVRQCYP